ncbi:uncharacterized protein LOC132611572 [Lycium barbarum]|uniref:uncharacterized protein LOC132611572 n=1 Tax=Lycium barbarum TaxID=112863 RepID=UPI00293E336A|nr:uncharacterized protein LOC132611572 [Lycium barbarum]
MSQHETAIAGSYAENRSKRINDPRRSKEYVDSKSKQQEKVKKVSKFLVTKHPAVVPSMCRYMNVNVMQDIRGKPTDPKMDMFRNSCFGKYLRMQQMDVQAQIFRCFMVKELRGSTYRCFTFEINGKVLRFGLREFALITELDCVSDENDLVYDNSKPNRLMIEYFGRNQENQLPVKRHELIECFNKTVHCGEPNSTNIPRIHFDVVEDGRYNEYPWGKDSFRELVVSIEQKYAGFKKYYRIHGLPLAIQVWLYECCSKVPSTIAVKTGNLIPRILNWRTTEGKPEFKRLMDGMFRDDKNPSCRFEEVVPTPHELETLKLPLVAHDIPDVKHGVDGVHGTDLVDDDFSTTPPHLSSGKQQQRSANSDSPRGKKRTQFPVSVPPSRKQASPKESWIKGTRKPDAPTGLRTDKFKLIREEIRIFKKEVFDYMDNNFKKLLDAIKGNQTPDKVGDTMLQADLHSDGEISQGNQSGGAVKLSTKENQGGGATSAQRSHPVESQQIGDMENANAEFTASEEMVADLLVNCPLACVIPLGPPPVPRDDQTDLSSLRTPQNLDDNPVTISQWMISDSQIPIQLGVQPTTGQSSTNETEQQVGVQPIVGHNSSDETGEQVPVQPNAGQSSSGETAQLSNTEKQIIVHLGAARERKPSKYNLSPYCPNFSSAGSSAKNINPCIYQKKHPFVDHPINAPLDTSFLQEYQKWLEKDLLKSHDKRKPKENHYRKNKEELDPADAKLRLHLGVTTISDKNWFYLLSMDGQLWIDEHIDVIFCYLRKKGKYHNNNNYKFTTASCIFHTLVVEIYKSWENSDSSTCVASKEDELCEYINGHRLLVNVQWCIYVYNSYRASGHDAVVRAGMKMLATLVTHSLQMTDFYEKKADIDFATHPSYRNREQTDNFDIVNVDNLPQQAPSSMDCGVYAVAFAEYLSSSEVIPTEFDAKLFCMRYGALLCDYAWDKSNNNASSDNEQPPRPIRPAVDYDAVDKEDLD